MKELHIVVNAAVEGTVAGGITMTITETVMVTTTIIITTITTIMEITTTMEEGWIATRGIAEVILSMEETLSEHEKSHL